MSKGFSIGYASYKLLYRQAFGTAHGSRHGTEAVFVRIEFEGSTGYGEATLPPYVDETPASVIGTLSFIDIQSVITNYLNQGISSFQGWDQHVPPAARAAITTAVLDLQSKRSGRSVADLLGLSPKHSDRTATSVTLGIGSIADIPYRISQLPHSDLIKVKLGGTEDIATVKAVQACDQRPMLLDANQGWNSVADALRVLETVGPGRLAGLEQPFAKDAWALHAQLQTQLDVPIHGDESIQDISDMETAVGHFQGVNIKLMKCGGLDRALAMIYRAKDLDLKVMLGCMSESSLGCAAMAQLQSYADIADLDGPWLIGNDPFGGLHLEPGGLWTDSSSGFGVDLIAHLDWTPIGA